MAPFSDEFLFMEMANKVRNASGYSNNYVQEKLPKYTELVIFLVCSLNNSVIIHSISMQAMFWQQQNYYGVDLTPLFGSAHEGYFSQVYLFTHQHSVNMYPFTN